MISKKLCIMNDFSAIILLNLTYKIQGDWEFLMECYLDFIIINNNHLKIVFFFYSGTKIIAKIECTNAIIRIL